MSGRALRLQPRPPSAARFLLVALLAPIALLAFYGWLHAEFNTTEATRAAARRSYQQRLLSTRLLSSLREAESAQRGYLLTDDLRYLSPYGPAKRHTFEDAQALVSGESDAAQGRRIAALRAIAIAKVAEMDRTIAVRRSGQREAALAIVAHGSGRQMMLDATARADAVVAGEQRLLDAAIQRYAGKMRQTRAIILSAVATFTVFLYIALFLLWRLQNARHSARIESLEASERNRSVLESAHDALLIINPSGTIEEVNPATTAMLGYQRGELLRRDIDSIVQVTAGDGSFFERLGVQGGRLRQSLLIERQARHRDGRTIPVDVALSLMPLPSGMHVVASLRDISERKRMERVKDDLISTINHELRTPLTSVVGALGLLRARTASELPPDVLRLIEISDNNARRLIRLVNDMLDLDRVNMGALQLHRTVTDLREAARRACEGAEGAAALRQVRIACDLPAVSVMIDGDADRLIQVVTNLLSNAIRVTSPRGVVSVGMSFETAREAIVTVDDDGPGVPLGFRDRIFGRFERAENNEDSAGAGLGLAISRAIVDGHDGRIWFEDRPGGGTRFAFALPVRRAPEPLAVEGPARLLICAAGTTQRRMTDLFVADHYQVDCVADAAAARHAIERNRYDALLLELRLPDESGLMLAHDLRRADGSTRLPIIIVADHLQEDMAVQGSLDVVDWITKPIDPSRLSAAVLVAVSRSGTRPPVILHLDDDEDILEITAAMLQPDAVVLKASTLPEARALLETTTPDAAILDLKLADGSGLDLLPMLVNADGLAIPTIIFSAQEVTPDAAEKVDAVLVKSRKSLPDLRATVRRVIRAAQVLP